MNDRLGESIIKEITDRKKEKTKHNEENFQVLIVKKTSRMISKTTYKKSSS